MQNTAHYVEHQVDFSPFVCALIGIKSIYSYQWQVGVYDTPVTE